ncbi:MAG: putative drug exporter of the superfamily, partial [Solirubrobacteraceae bacterium]|nr:putative drug exporter of the superfamily [Solirubrobacteraceae bacterium]
MASLKLTVVAGPAEGTTIPLGDQPFTIGRSGQGIEKLGDDPELSRAHARIHMREGSLVVEDLGSLNGTIVNGRRIDAVTELHPGDSLEVGTSTLRVDGPPEQDVAAPQVTAVRRRRPVAPPTPSEAGATLRVVAGASTGIVLTLVDGQLVLGREEQGEGRLGGDDQLSRQHARVSQVEGRLVIEDLGSTNGTFVNGARIPAPTVLKTQDAIWVGNSTLVVVTPEHPVGAVAPVAPPPPSAESGLLSRFATLSDNHPKRILAAIGVFLVIAAVIGGPTAGVLTKNPGGFDVPGSESVKTDQRIARASGEFPGAQVIVMVRAGQPVTSAAARSQVQTLVTSIKRERLVTRTLTFYSTRNRAFVSKNGRETFIAAFLKNASDPKRGDAAKRIADRVERKPTVLVGGPALTSAKLNERVGMDLGKAEAVAFPLLFLLSLFVFRGVVAALMPIFVGMLTVLSTFLVLRIVNTFVELSPFALNVVVGLGLGLAIDYSLFVVSRYREELARVGRGRPPSRIYGAVPRGEAGAEFAGSESEALRRAIYTAGRTILYSAITVAIALATLITFPQGFLYSMGIGGAATALVAVTVSLVALPSLLAVLGPRLNALSFKRWQRAAQRTAAQEREGPWYTLAQTVMRRPGPIAAGTALLLILMGIPAWGIKFTGVDSSAVPSDLTPR